MTVAGLTRLQRLYLRCEVCRDGGFPLDKHLGINGWMSRRGQRLACLAGASWSFDRAAQHLEEFCGLRISDTTIRAVCQEHGANARRWQQENPQAAEAFRQATGGVELATDGTHVNTMGGWREMRLSVFAKRERGQSQSVVRWEERDLPKPNARVAFAEIRAAEKMGAQWRRCARQLGLTQTADVTVLADGAHWIWKQVERHLPDAQGVLDIYHASQHLYETAGVLHGEGRATTHRWVHARRGHLLRGGTSALFTALAEDRRQTRSLRKRASLDALMKYFRPHAAHTRYHDRLRQGQTIGSGLVEGACKNVVGRRLKQTGARWRIRRVSWNSSISKRSALMPRAASAE